MNKFKRGATYGERYAQIKQSGRVNLDSIGPNFKAPNLIVLDANAKRLLRRKDSKMILDK